MAHAIHRVNPFYITEEIVERFERRVRQIAGALFAFTHSTSRVVKKTTQPLGHPSTPRYSLTCPGYFSLVASVA